MSAAPAIARRLTVTGRVQGVGYRYAMIDVACGLGVVGWVRNRRDGSVETWVQGSAEAVEQLIAWSRRGPRGALVVNCTVEPVEIDAALIEFGLAPTA